MPALEPPALLPRVLLVLFIADAIIIGTIMSTQVSLTIGLAAAAAAMLLPLLAIPLVIAILNVFTGWSTLARSYPAQPMADSALRGDADSLGMRSPWLAYNHCIRWAADDNFLHLRILPLFDRFSRPMSIPWAEIDFDESAPPVGRITPLVRLETAPGIPIFVPPQVVERERARRLAAPA